MSRKPPSSTNSRSTANPSLIRAPSSTNINASMPPPSRVPNRPPSVMSSSTQRGDDVPGSRSASPTRGKRVVSAEKKLTKSVTSEKVVDGEEMNIQVVVRCRGRSAMEISQRTPIICQTTGAVSSAITIETSHSAMSNTSGLGLPVTTLPYSERAPVSKTYGFDRVFGPEADQTIVYKEVVQSMLDEVIAGYNCTIFAYGQTGTGKTYTMAGDITLTPVGKPAAEAGIIPRVLHRLFTLLESVPNAEFSVKCSYVELYNEELRDLLASDFHQPVALGGTAQGVPGGLKIYDDANKKGGVTIQGLEETSIRNAKEGLGLLTKGSQRRQVAETKMNTESSRSHSIFSLTVHIKETSIHGGEDLLKVGKLNLVDLAGSEAIGRSGAENKRAREAGMINQSLLTLGRVISALVEKNSHVPYRESKLTRLLQDSLGGRTKTCIVATVSPTKSNMEETLSTLDYAIRAKTIRNKPEINQRLTKGTLIKDYVVEIERLKSDLSAAHQQNGIYFSAETWEEMSSEHEERKNQLEDIKQRADTLENKHATLTAEFESNMAMLLVREDELATARQQAEELKVEIQRVQQAVVELTSKVDEERWVGETYRQGEERIDGIAKGLKGTVVQSLNDVGGLFAKIARKSDVLMSNADSTSKYSSQLNNLADRLHQDMDVLKTVQSNFGGTLQKELEALAKRGRETLELDKVFLDEKLQSFAASANTYQEKSQTEQMANQEMIAKLSTQQGSIQSDLVQWMTRLQEGYRQRLRNLQVQHASHLQEVHGSMEIITETLDAIVGAAVERTNDEHDSASKLHATTKRMHEQEVQGLRHQNEQLAAMLEQEQITSAKLKEDLVTQITGLLTGFTAKQSQTMKTAVDAIRGKNDLGVESSRQIMARYDAEAEQAARRSTQYREDLSSVKRSAASSREDAQKAMTGMGTNLSTLLDETSRQMEDEITSQQKFVTDWSHETARGLTAVGNAISQSHTAANDGLIALQNVNAHCLDAAKERLVIAKEDIKVVSAAVLSAHAAAEPLFAQHCAQAQSQIQDLRVTHEAFVTGIREDVPTGSTPRKKTYNVPADWHTTQPREALLQRYRSRIHDDQLHNSSVVVYEQIGEEQTMTEQPASPEPSEPPSTVSQTEMVVESPSPVISSVPLVPSAPSPEPVLDERQQENIPPAAVDSWIESAPADLIKKTGRVQMPTGITKPRSGMTRSNSALTESTTNLPMRKTRRLA